MFPFYRLAMPNDLSLTPADPAEMEQAFAHALQYDGRKAFRLSGESMAKITAAHLVGCLAGSGFVVTRKPPARGRSNTGVGKPGE